MCQMFFLYESFRKNLHRTEICKNLLLLSALYEKVQFFVSDSTQAIDHIQKCFRQKLQCSRRPSYSTTLFFFLVEVLKLRKVNSTFLNGTMFFFNERSSEHHVTVK